MRRTRDTLATLCWSGLLLAGLPVALVRLVGWPLPGHVPTAGQWAGWLAQPLTRPFLIGVGALVGWVMWATLLATVLASLYTRVARMWRRLPQVRLPGPVQSLSAAMLGSVAVGSAGTVLVAPAAATAAVSAADTSPGPAGLAADWRPATPPAAIAANTRAVRPATVVLRRGDWLGPVAQRFLGDFDRYPAIAALNPGLIPDRSGPHGPDHVEPGWRLVLPADAHDRGVRRHATGRFTPAVARPPAAHPGTAARPRRPAPPPPTGSATVPSTSPPASTNGTGRAGDQATTGGPSGSPSAAASAPSPRRRDGSGQGVDLSGGGWVEEGLAAALVTAAALVWMRRRRRYQPRPPSPAPRLDDLDLPVTPRVVHELRRGLHRTSRPPTRPVGQTDAVPPPIEPEGHGEHGATARTTTTVAAPPSATPMRWPSAGLGLTGPGATAAARGLLLAALTRSATDTAPAGTAVVIPSDILSRMLGAAGDATLLPQVRVTADLAEAIGLLEEHALRRARLLIAHDADTVAALPQSDLPGGPPGPLLLVADATAVEQPVRVAALLAQGPRLDIHGVLLGAWEHGTTVRVAADGSTTPTGGGDPRADAVGPLSVLTARETGDLLRTLSEAHTLASAPGAAPQARPETRREDTPPDTKDAPAAPGGARSAARRVAHGDTDTDADTKAAAAVTSLGDGSHTERRTTVTGPVRVRLLGPPRIEDLPPSGPGDALLRPQAVELLVYLAAVGGAADRDRILEDLLGDVPRSRAPHRLNTYAYSLRSNLKRAGGPGVYVGPPDQRYALNRDLLDIDLWRMQHAIAEATAATDPAIRVAALQTAVAAYTGPLAEGRDYEWVEPYREAVRRQALDAHVALADTLSDKHPQQAVAVLNTAIGHDPYNEPLYQQAMRLQAQLGDVEAIARLRDALARAMADIDAEPDTDSLALAGRLLADLRPRRPAPTGR